MRGGHSRLLAPCWGGLAWVGLFSFPFLFMEFSSLLSFGIPLASSRIVRCLSFQVRSNRGARRTRISYNLLKTYSAVMSRAKVYAKYSSSIPRVPRSSLTSRRSARSTSFVECIHLTDKPSVIPVSGMPSSRTGPIRAGTLECHQPSIETGKETITHK